jgi:hypothetical protein
MSQQWFSLRPYGRCAVLRATGYGSILATFVMVGLRFRPHWWLTTLLATSIGILGPSSLVLLMLQTEVRRWEGWFACICCWMLLIVLMLPAIGAD